MLKTRINAILYFYFTTETFSFRIKILQLKKASNNDKMNIEMTKPILIFQFLSLAILLNTILETQQYPQKPNFQETEITVEHHN